jgi:SAM-dependent methyltransferase
MTVESFFELFIKELQSDESLRRYYRFLENKTSHTFRKAYFCQRLQYIFDQVHQYQLKYPGRSLKIWDCGCGYATTQIFLALNGYASTGNTLEFYYKEIPKRLEYWNQFGNLDKVSVSYEDVFEKAITPESTDIIIVQDTLHHLEPLQKSLEIFNRTIRPGGIVIAVEENGANVIQRLKLYLRRGNRRVIEYYDEGLQRMVTMGNENIRSLELWEKEFQKAGLLPDSESYQYIRLFPPFFYKIQSEEEVYRREQKLWRKSSLLRNYFFFGINFVGRKN